MIFKTQLYIGKVEPLSHKSSPRYKTSYCLEFSKNKIYFTEDVLKLVNGISGVLFPLQGSHGIRHTEPYTLVRLESDDVDRMKGSKFKIKLQSGASFNIASGGWNGIIMRTIHKRYWIQKNFDTIGKALITIISSIISGVVVGLITYKLGFNVGLKEGLTKAKSEQQDTLKKQVKLR